MSESQKDENKTARRKFLKLGAIGGAIAALAGGFGIFHFFSEKEKPDKGKKIRLLSPDGKIVEVDSSVINPVTPDIPISLREGQPNKKFVMVIDLSKCANAGRCKKACSKMHYLPPEKSYIRIEKMQDAETTAPYYMPTPCFHCDEPPCVKVCPVDATFKRTDGIVAIDNERCIGCRFCMAACPYSARVFNWSEDEFKLTMEEMNDIKPHKACSSHIKGTVEKCDFCPSHAEKGILPDCVTACPNGVFYFGNELEDVVTNGDETLSLSKLLKDKAGYRYLEELGTKPSVYYLPPVDRMFPFKDTGETKKA